MQLFALILFCAVLTTSCAEPDPKKYKSEVKEKDKATNASLTDDERKFLREVEEKFGIKSDVPVTINDTNEKTNTTEAEKAPFPAVIAIEIVNDTETNTKGKRTIDANLGYGYRTNNGYTYTYFGKQPQEKAKFMIYPYSQEDIPPAHPNSYNSASSYVSGGHYTTPSPNVEIQPSRAYELIDVKEEQNSYHYEKPTPSTNYQDIKGLVSPPPSYSTSESHQESSPPQTHPSTLYTTYNGHDFSSLSGQFPTVMSNYLVDSSQLVRNPQYQSAGISQDYIRSHGAQQDQKVVPVLVLRIPSSYLKKPTAELYSDLPQNSIPISNYLNKDNLQEIVNNYFKKIGYSSAPQLMTYQNSVLSEQASPPAHSEAYDPQNYATPYVQQPSYTQADHSGVQYSGVKPVMAMYPSTFMQQQYYDPNTQTVYQQPEQQYEYTYQYSHQPESAQPQYGKPQYQSQSESEEVAPQDSHSENGAIPSNAGIGPNVEYGSQVIQETAAPSMEYGASESQGAHHGSPAVSHYETNEQTASQEYGAPREQAEEYSPKYHAIVTDYGPTKFQLPAYSSSQSASSHYGTPKHSVPKETIAFYQSQLRQTAPQYNTPSVGSQNYYYQKQTGEDSASQLVLSENYPSKDHTIATVLPFNYKRDKKPNGASIQSVSYVTPVPFSSKYKMPYKIMGPQTVFRNPATEKVSYVNSHSMPFSQLVNQEYNPEAEYTVPSRYIPPIGKQKPSSYPRNYHAHPKRNVKSESKPAKANTTSRRKQKERGDSRKSS